MYGVRWAVLRREVVVATAYRHITTNPTTTIVMFIMKGRVARKHRNRHQQRGHENNVRFGGVNVNDMSHGDACAFILGSG